MHKKIDFNKLLQISGENCGRLEEELYKFSKVFEKEFDFKYFLKNPRYASQDKRKLAQSIFPGFLPLFWDLIELLIKEGLVDRVAEISKEFTKILADMDDKRFDVVVFSEKPTKELIAKAKKKAGDKISLRFEIDPSILGGFIWKTMDGKMLDASLRGRLAQLKEEINA
ncbi:MAG: ATP synthase F1 subunit delta [Candidatus Margulisiibacteriota bacterium]|jgi:ATP synthase F1 delta subunit